MKQPGFEQFWSEFSPVFAELVPADTVSAAFAHRLLSYSNSPDPRVLDLACGIGRHTMPLLRAGVLVESWDVDKVALRVLQESATQEGLSASVLQRDFLVSDLSDASDAFDLIVCLGSTMIMMDRTAQAAWMRNISAVLKPNGTAFVEVHHRPYIEALHDNRTKVRLEMGTYQNQPVEALASWNPASDQWKLEYSFYADGEQRETVEIANIPDSRTVEKLAAENGLSVASRFSSWDETLPSSDPRVMTYVLCHCQE